MPAAPRTVLPGLVVFLVLVLGIGPGHRKASAAVRLGGEGTPAGVRAGIVVVKFRAPASQAAKTGPSYFGKVSRQHGVYAVEPIFPWLKGAAGKQSAALQQLYYARYRGNTSPQAVAVALARDPGVEYAEPLYMHHLYGPHPYDRVPDDAPRAMRDTEPDDPRFEEMEYLRQVQAPAAWDVVQGVTGKVVIAVVDGGTDWRHEDLEANVWTNAGEVPGNGRDDDGNEFVDDVHGWNFADDSPDPTGLATTPGNARHGTIVAGVAAAVTGNGLGVAGMSWNARFMPVNVGCGDGDDLICFGYEGIVYAAASGARIINASWGRTGRPSRFEQELIDYAYEQGALVVAAAGNGGSDGIGDSNDDRFELPPNYNHVLAVGATQKTSDLRAGFSNYGVTVDVFAPGVGVVSTQPDNEYTASANGTSFSAPLVSGLAALVATLHPGWSVDQVREQVRVTSDDIDADNPVHAGELGKGRINAFRAVTEQGHPAIRLVDFDFDESGGDGNIQGGETVEVAARFTNYLADASGVAFAVETDDPYVTLQAATAARPLLSTGDTTTISFSFSLAEQAPDEHLFHLVVRVEAEGYADADLMEFFANPAPIVVHDTGTLQTAMTTQGNIGWTTFDPGFDPDTRGVGFVFADRNWLFEGGLMVGTSSTQVSDCIRGMGAGQEDDFRPEEGSNLELIESAPLTFQETSVELVDTPAARPLDISVLQESYADTSEGLRNFVVVRYTITNTAVEAIRNLFAGLFFDWDLNPEGDYARFEAVRRLGFVQDAAVSPTILTATKLLTTRGAWSYRAIDNPAEIYGGSTGDGFTPQEKWAFLSGGLQTQRLDNTDASTLSAAGPFTVLPGCSVEVGFAVLGAESTGALQQSADRAQALWENKLRVAVPNQPPAFDGAPVAATVAEGAVFHYALTASDGDECDVLHYALIDPPANASIDSETGRFTFSPDFSQTGTVPIVAVVVDGIAADTARFAITVVNTNRAPAFSLVLGDTTVATGRTLSFSFAASDPDGEDVSYSLVDPPANAGIDAASGAFTFSPGVDQVGTFAIIAVITDGALDDTARAHVEVIEAEFALRDAFPNPATVAVPVTFQFQLPEESSVRLLIYDVLGRQVRRLATGARGPGRHTAYWDGTDDAGQFVGSGLYFYRLVASYRGGTFNTARKLVVLR